MDAQMVCTARRDTEIDRDILHTMLWDAATMSHLPPCAYETSKGRRCFMASPDQ